MTYIQDESGTNTVYILERKIVHKSKVRDKKLRNPGTPYTVVYGPDFDEYVIEFYKQSGSDPMTVIRPGYLISYNDSFYLQDGTYYVADIQLIIEPPDIRKYRMTIRVYDSGKYIRTF